MRFLSLRSGTVGEGIAISIQTEICSWAIRGVTLPRFENTFTACFITLGKALVNASRL